MKTLKLLLLVATIALGGCTTAQTLAVYVSDAGNFNSGPWQIAKFDETGNFEGQLMNDDDDIVWPQDIFFLDSEEAVLISNLGAAGIISKHHWATGNLEENFAEGLGGPTRMKVGPDGKLYVLQWSNTVNKVLRFELDGTPLGDFTSIGIAQSIGIDWDAGGDLYVSSYGGNLVQKFDGTTGADLGPFIDTGLSGPTNIFFEASGNLVVFNYNSGIIQRFDATGNYIEDLIAGVVGCEGFDFFPNGDILIGVGSDGSVRRYDSSYTFIENFVDPGILLTPNAIVIRDDIPLGLVDNKLATIFVTPTVGTQFKITNEAASLYNAIQVFDTNGKLLETVTLENSSIWNASHLTEGVYIIVASENGRKSSQKIVVKKN